MAISIELNERNEQAVVYLPGINRGAVYLLGINRGAVA